MSKKKSANQKANAQNEAPKKVSVKNEPQKNVQKNAQKNTQKNASKAANAVDWLESTKTAAILFAICAVITALLAATNMLTENKIAENSLANKYEACRAVISADDYVELDCGYDVYLAMSNGSVVGCTVTTQASGYGGAITVMVGFDMDGDITGVDIIEHDETPGLGANATKPSFLDQFISEDKEGHSDNYAVKKDGGDIDAVTAATMSSRAVSAAVNSACDIFDELYSNGVLVAPAANQGGEE